jgi:hypothetical protein
MPFKEIKISTFKEIKIPTLGPTTKMATLMDDAGKLMTGDESYPVIGTGGEENGPLISAETIRAIISEMKGLNQHWDCLPKAQKAVNILGFGWIVAGSLLVTSGDYESQYGYYFNPPYEFHAWVVLDDPRKYPKPRLMDMALAGVIDKGLNTSDEVGPCLLDREPSILVGYPPDWCQYIPVEVITQ